MKNLIKVAFLAILAVMTVSCQKQVIYPTGQLPSNVPTGSNTANSISMWGEFVVTDAVMYMDNHETGEKTVYQHFNTGKTVSSMRLGGSLFDIETIEKNVTTYSFYQPINNTGRFVLNEDSTKLYDVNYMGQYTSIIENPKGNGQLMGGSSRPYSGWTTDFTNNVVTIHIEQMEGSYNGNNVSYYTELKLKKIKSW